MINLLFKINESKKEFLEGYNKLNEINRKVILEGGQYMIQNLKKIDAFLGSLKKSKAKRMGYNLYILTHNSESKKASFLMLEYMKNHNLAP